jgi:hypothetical protein
LNGSYSDDHHVKDGTERQGERQKQHESFLKLHCYLSISDAQNLCFVCALPNHRSTHSVPHRDEKYISEPISSRLIG